MPDGDMKLSSIWAAGARGFAPYNSTCRDLIDTDDNRKIMRCRERRFDTWRCVVCCSLPGLCCRASPIVPWRIAISAVLPATGSTLGGTSVTVTGSGFDAGTTLLIGTAPAENVQ